MEERVSSKDVMKFGLRGYKEFVDYNWHGKMIKIRTLLTHKESMELVQSIINCCPNNDDGFIVPDFLDVSIRANIIRAYSNVDLPSDFDEQYKLLYCSTLFDVVCKEACTSQIDAIIWAAHTYAGI